METIKHPSIEQPGLHFWAEAVAEHGDGRKVYGVIAQADGYPETEAYSDWFGKWEDADLVARMLARGEDPGAADEQKIDAPGHHDLMGIAVQPEDRYEDDEDALEQRERFQHTIGAGAFTRS